MPKAALLREAFAAGWAASSGPLTPHVHASYRAALNYALQHVDRHDALETTLHLGHLEGTWAAMLERREAQHAAHIAAVMRRWQRLVATLDVPGAVRAFRRSAGMAEAGTDDAAAARTAAAMAAAKELLVQAIEAAGTSEYDAVITALADALRAATAEGTAQAIAIGAAQRGTIGIDFDLAFKDAWQALADLEQHWSDARGWLEKIVNGAAGDLGRTLARLAEDGATFNDMVTAARDVIGSADVRAVETLVDLAMGQSYSRGALALYGRERVRTVDFFTAGGANVCPLCMRLEAQNPWPIDEVPAPPRHPRCRCVIVASEPMQSLDFSAYMKGTT